MRCRSFHSTHAASQALHPMQVVVSMYLETTGTVRMPEWLPHTDAEERRISRACVVLIVVPLSCLIELDEERLELGRPSVGVHGGGRQEVGERSGVVRIAGVAPVDRKTDLPVLLAIDL